MWRIVICALCLSGCGAVAPSLSLQFRWDRPGIRDDPAWGSRIFLGLGVSRRTKNAAPAREAVTAYSPLERARCRSRELCRWQLDAERSAQ